MRANGIVRVDVFELNQAIHCDQKYSRYRQLVVFRAGCRFEIDSILCKKLQRGIIHLIGYPEGPRSCHFTVGKKSEGDFVFFNGLTDFSGLVRRNSNDLKSQTAEL